MNIPHTEAAAGAPDVRRTKPKADLQPEQARRPGEGKIERQREDRVEISTSAREAAEAQARQARELEKARSAMLTIPPLSADQALDILKRIEKGDYSQPEVIMQYASRLARDLIIDSIHREAVYA